MVIPVTLVFDPRTDEIFDNGTDSSDDVRECGRVHVHFIVPINTSNL